MRNSGIIAGLIDLLIGIYFTLAGFEVIKTYKALTKTTALLLKIFGLLLTLWGLDFIIRSL
jgi:hypothetical protein